jgi:hypothetical protein
VMLEPLRTGQGGSISEMRFSDGQPSALGEVP